MIDYREHSDVELVQAYLRGEERAFNEIHGRYEKKLQAFVYRKIGDREKAEDLVQEAFLRVSDHLTEFDQKKKFSTWIYVIADNLAKNEMRNRARDRVVFFQRLLANTNGWDESVLSFEDSRPSPENQVEESFFLGVLHLALSKINADRRRAFLLREVDGLSYGEAARVQGVPLGTLKSRIFRAREDLRTLMAKYGRQQPRRL